MFTMVVAVYHGIPILESWWYKMILGGFGIQSSNFKWFLERYKKQKQTNTFGDVSPNKTCYLEGQWKLWATEMGNSCWGEAREIGIWSINNKSRVCVFATKYDFVYIICKSEWILTIHKAEILKYGDLGMVS